jgi:hypothetical protein
VAEAQRRPSVTWRAAAHAIYIALAFQFRKLKDDLGILQVPIGVVDYINAEN